MTDRAQAIEEILRDAGVTIKPGMLVHSPKNAWDPMWNPARIIVAAAAEDDDIPILTDPATYALCLAQLARRLGLDPEQGVILVEAADYWYLRLGDGRCWLDGMDIPTDIDHRRALALALRATAPKETT